jgi:hypothetical protein
MLPNILPRRRGVWRSTCPCKISHPPAGMEKNTETDKLPHKRENKRDKTTYREKTLRFILNAGHI